MTTDARNGRLAKIGLSYALILLGLTELISLTELITPAHTDILNRMSFLHSGAYGFLAAALIGYLPLAWQVIRAPLEKLALLACALALTLTFQPDSYLGIANCLMASFGITAMLWLGLRLHGPASHQASLAEKTSYLEISALMALILVSGPCLQLTAALRPVTYDQTLYAWDVLLFGSLPSKFLFDLAEASTALRATFLMSYYALALFMIMAMLQARRAPRPLPVSVLGSFLATAAMGCAIYLIVPVCGPLYLFWPDFAQALPDMAATMSRSATLPPYPRNGMPSLHIAWALAIVFACSYMDIWCKVAALLVLTLTVLSTLALGEHYVVDLLAALPFAVMVQTLLTACRQQDRLKRRELRLLAALLTALAILIGTLDPSSTSQLPVQAWRAIWLALAIAALLTFRALKQIANASECLPQAPPSRQANPHTTLITAIFFLSGFAALIYQVLFSKLLGLTFGSTAIASFTVLTTYMSGLALGTFIGGWLSHVIKDRIRAYALSETLIALYCLATPLLLLSIRQLYQTLAQDLSPDDTTLVIYRVALGGLTLLIPTMLMGLTTPLLVAHLNHKTGLGTVVARLYSANTLGAALGALLTGYLMLPSLGATGTLHTAILINLSAAVLAFALRKHLRPPPETGANAWDLLPERPRHHAGARTPVVIAGVLFVTGFITLALETLYIQLLAVVAGNSTYAFSLMLFAFLSGLGLGAWLSQRILTHLPPPPPRTALLLAQAGLVISILAGTFAWDHIPAYFLDFANYPSARTFHAREFIRGLSCLLLMLPPAICIGMAFPLAMEVLGASVRVVQRPFAYGLASAINTVGNIAGVLVGGFVILPALGSLTSLKVLAAIACGLILVLTAMWWRQINTRAILMSVGAITLLALSSPRQLDMNMLASGANVYFSAQNYGQVIDYAESIDGGLTTVNAQFSPAGQRTLTLLTNGKFQGDDNQHREMRAQISFALAPLMHTTARERALIIGYGTGVSSRTLADAGFKQLDIVDLSRDILRMADRHFAAVNDHVRDRPQVSTYVTDGRNYLLLQDRRYDLISMEITSIWFAGAASMYSTEFYELAKRRLKADGVLQQWVQLHRISHSDIIHIIGTLRHEFRYVWVYYLGKQGIIVASNDAARRPGGAAITAITTHAELKPLMDRHQDQPDDLLQQCLLGPAGVDRLLGQQGLPDIALLSTDNNMLLEYSTPKGNIRPYLSSLHDNVAFLARFARPGDCTLPQPSPP